MEQTAAMFVIEQNLQVFSSHTRQAACGATAGAPKVREETAVVQSDGGGRGEVAHCVSKWSAGLLGAASGVLELRKCGGVAGRQSRGGEG